MTTINAANTSEFHAAVNIAQAGDIIRMTGKSYGALSVNRKNVSGAPLVITAIEKMDIVKIQCRESNNITWDLGGQVATYTEAGRQKDTAFFDLHGSTNCTVRNGHFKSDGLGRAFYAIDRNGFHDGLIIEDMKIEHFFRGIVSWKGSNLTIRRNEIFDTIGDHMQFGGNLDGVLIENNHIHSTIGDGPGKTHSDAIQFVTYNATLGEVAKNVTIRGNRIDVRDGPEYMQSIFLANEVFSGVNGQKAASLALQGDDRMRYRGFVIEGNEIYNLHTHGITIGASDGAIVRRNTLIRPDFDHNANPGQPNDYPAIRLGSAVNPTVENNVSGDYSGVPAGGNNLTIQDTEYAANFDMIKGANGNEWKVKSGSLVSLSGAGAPSMLSGAPTPIPDPIPTPDPVPTPDPTPTPMKWKTVYASNGGRVGDRTGVCRISGDGSKFELWVNSSNDWSELIQKPDES